jgi:hypothetical protein
MVALLHSLAVTLRVDLLDLKTQNSSIPPSYCGWVPNVQTYQEWNEVPEVQSASWVWWYAAVQIMCLYVHAMIIQSVCCKYSICLPTNPVQPRAIKAQPNKTWTTTFHTRLSCLTGHLWHLNIDAHAYSSLFHPWLDIVKEARQAANWPSRIVPTIQTSDVDGQSMRDRWALVPATVIAIIESPAPSRRVNKHELPEVDKSLSVFR